MLQSSLFHRLSFDGFSLPQYRLGVTEVDIRRRHIEQALVIPSVVVIVDKSFDVGLEVTRQIVVLQQQPVLDRLMPALNLALRHRVVWGTTDVVYALVFKPLAELLGTACRHQPCPALATTRQTDRSPRSAIRDWRLVYRGLRHQGPQDAKALLEELG